MLPVLMPSKCLLLARPLEGMNCRPTMPRPKYDYNIHGRHNPHLTVEHDETPSEAELWMDELEAQIEEEYRRDWFGDGIDETTDNIDAARLARP